MDTNMIKLKNNLFFIQTYGCQMNEEDSEKISGMLKRIGYSSTEVKEEAGIIIYNTCCIRENAETKVFGNLGHLKALKRKNPDLIIAICGCMMQQEGMVDKILNNFPFVNIIFGTHNAFKFPEYLNRVKTEGIQVKEIFNKETEIVEGIPIDRKSEVKAFVTIMYGCNNFCTYCVVPYVRGRERSRTPKDIVKEIEGLISKGYKEITLLGQNVNSYGKGLDEEITFAMLLRKINEVPGIERIRFMTPHPKDLTEDVILAIRDCDKVCEQIHLPVQSGSNRILKKMNRNYTRENYIELIKKIRKEIPGVTITTDLIIGFPGETEEDFEDTLNLAKEIQYSLAFTYLYSRRNNTPADIMLNQVADNIKHERFNKLVDVINKGVISQNKTYEGQTVEVLVEGSSKNDLTMLTGRTRNGKLVNFKGQNIKSGDLVLIKIIRAQPFSLIGEVI
nr:tRNA (N6-isopentenyl adenosine(37)-C2)-methylthiotransferase MiaB [Clostridium gasigenes]